MIEYRNALGKIPRHFPSHQYKQNSWELAAVPGEQSRMEQLFREHSRQLSNQNSVCVLGQLCCAFTGPHSE